MYDLSVKKVQDVRVGDKLMGVDGTPRNVLSTTKGQGQLYEVQQGKGMNYVVNDAHILCLKHSGKDVYKTIKQKKIYQGRKYFNGIHKKTADEYFKLSKREARQYNGFKTGVELPERPVLLDPYFLGLWLGDGLKAGATITNIDPEVREYLKQFAKDNGLNYTQDKSDKNNIRLGKTFGKTNIVTQALRFYDILNNKHIPHDYLHNNRETRLQLLAGLIDSDGGVENGMFCITGCDKSLMQQVVTLSRSLGFYTCFRKKIAKMKRKDGSVYVCDAWTVSISSNDYSIIPTKIARKKLTGTYKFRDCLQTKIKLQDKGQGWYYGFQLDGDKMFMLEDFTVTHNTECIIRVLFAYAINFPRYRITVVTNTIPKLKEDALRIALEVADKPKVAMFIKQYNMTDRVFTFTNGSHITFKSFENELQAQGEKRDILYVVEMPRITWATFYQAYLRTEVRVFGCYNPTSSFYVHRNILANKVEFNSVQVFRSWHIHNPYLPQLKHDQLERITDKIMHAVYARGLTGMLRGTIYPDWVLVEDDEYGGPDGSIWGVDWAFSEDKRADPSACVRVKRNPPNRLDLDYIIDLVAYDQGISAPEIAQVQKAEGYKDGQATYCDHALQQIYELQLNGITGATTAVKGPGSLLARILFVKRKRIGVTRRSRAIWEIEQPAYRFLEVEGVVTNTPIDEYNHAMDASGYAIYSDALTYGYT